MAELISYALLHAHEVLMRTSEHVQLAFVSLAAASVIGILLGLGAFHWRYLRTPILLLTGILQTIPGLALLALLLVLFRHIGALPAIAALTLYALLPIVSGTLTGLEATSPAFIESAESLGLTRWQQLRLLRLPLAVPQLISGIRVAANINIGMVTVAAFIGAGGLGQLINRGLFLADSRLILLGAIPAALLAIIIDAMIAFIQHSFFARRARSWMKKIAAVMLPALLLVASFCAAESQVPEAIRIGSKNFTEQLILGEILAQTLEQHTSLPVERRFSLGGSLIAHRALLADEIDMYVEYSGTALASILRQPVEGMDPKTVLQRVCNLYQQRYALHCLVPLGFNDSYVLAMHKQQAQQLDIHRLSQLKSHAHSLHAGFDFEFAARPDGYPSLQKALGVAFASVREMEPSLMYQALNKGTVDIISAYSTDGRLSANGLVPIEDDLHVFPPYDAFLVVSDRFYRQHPEAVSVLEKLGNSMNAATMRQLNYQVDHLKMDPKEVASAWLKRNNTP